MGKQIPVHVSWTETARRESTFMIDEQDVKAWLGNDEPVTPELVKEYLTDNYQPTGEAPAWFPKIVTPNRTSTTTYELNDVEVG